MRSKFEVTLSKKLKNCDYEPETLSYTSYHDYIPDFVPRSEPNIKIEAKGRFRTRAEASKYVDVQRCNPDVELVFVFMAPSKPMPGARKRKDGTRFTHAQWAEKNNFRWFTLKTLPAEWCKKK